MVWEGWTRRFTLRRSPPSRNRRKQAKPSRSLNADHRPAIFGCSSPERRRAMSSALPYRNSGHDANTWLCLYPSPHLPRDPATDVTLLFFIHGTITTRSPSPPASKGVAASWVSSALSRAARHYALDARSAHTRPLRCLDTPITPCHAAPPLRLCCHT
jgi:hypothetical protein